MQRGQVFDARLEPVEGSEQGGTRPVIIVSRDAINTNSPVVLAVPCTTHGPHRKVHPTQVLIQAGEAGFVNNSIAMADQVRVLSKQRLLKLRGTLTPTTLGQLEQALLIALDLPGQS